MLAIGKCNVQGAVSVTREDATLSGEGGLFHLSYHTERASGRLNAKEVWEMYAATVNKIHSSRSFTSACASWHGGCRKEMKK